MPGCGVDEQRTGRSSLPQAESPSCLPLVVEYDHSVRSRSRLSRSHRRAMSAMIPVTLVAATLAAAPAGAASTRTTHAFDIPAGPLSRSILILGRQANVTIGAFGQAIDNKRGRRLRGLYTV